MILSNLKFIILFQLRGKQVSINIFSSGTRKHKREFADFPVFNREQALKAIEYLLLLIILTMLQNLSLVTLTFYIQKFLFLSTLGVDRGQVMSHLKVSHLFQ